MHKEAPFPQRVFYSCVFLQVGVPRVLEGKLGHVEGPITSKPTTAIFNQWQLNIGFSFNYVGELYLKILKVNLNGWTMS